MVETHNNINNNVFTFKLKFKNKIYHIFKRKYLQ